MSWYNNDYMQNLMGRNEIQVQPTGLTAHLQAQSRSIPRDQGQSAICVSLVNQVDQCVANMCPQPVLSKMDVLAHEVHVEDSMLRNGRLPSQLFSQDGNSPRPRHWIIESHQLHFGKIYSKKKHLITVTDSNPCPESDNSCFSHAISKTSAY